ncbi:MAG: repressor LexA [Candidatus Vogelbacteria bacterium CG10_big_fil_rev_8_21_14_0_10_45_14]|uniref:Repressor LexA n=1 Tax=Candidatus Vogelbacteria bacterium CG10_big_fil_rev_8_21_14_0_10_45_14 TaxID=1975042 RepID=A0A2H0RK56_9BACT|nr:MAG: repressor LexA [Candidatus Vogelbacteria bacterium CG10_big_fil_rev_8_21_14_0_10_45_14]
MRTANDKSRMALIRKFYRDKKRMPSFSEMGELVGFNSKNAVFRMVDRLVKEGFLEKDKQGKVLPKQLFGSVRMLGVVEAGFPSPAEEELMDTMTFDEYLVRKPESTFVLKTKGDSMKDAGIVDGDMVVVERTAKHKAGDIVIAEVDGDWTMKYLRGKPGNWWLAPANKKYKNIRPKGEMKVEAVVRAIVRKYR